jgi:hypothetical protein
MPPPAPPEAVLPSTVLALMAAVPPLTMPPAPATGRPLAVLPFHLAEVDDEDVAAHVHADGVVGDVAASLGRGVVIDLAGVQDQRAAMG